MIYVTVRYSTRFDKIHPKPLKWAGPRLGDGGTVTYTTVGTVSPPALLGGLVDLDVLDDQVAGIETLGIGVGLGVLEEVLEELGGLDGPAGLGDTELLAC